MKADCRPPLRSGTLHTKGATLCSSIRKKAIHFLSMQHGAPCAVYLLTSGPPTPGQGERKGEEEGKERGEGAKPPKGQERGERRRRRREEREGEEKKDLMTLLLL